MQICHEHPQRKVQETIMTYKEDADKQRYLVEDL